MKLELKISNDAIAYLFISLGFLSLSLLESVPHLRAIAPILQGISLVTPFAGYFYSNLIQRLDRNYEETRSQRKHNAVVDRYHALEEILRNSTHPLSSHLAILARIQQREVVASYRQITKALQGKVWDNDNFILQINSRRQILQRGDTLLIVCRDKFRTLAHEKHQDEIFEILKSLVLQGILVEIIFVADNIESDCQFSRKMLKAMAKAVELAESLTNEQRRNFDVRVLTRDNLINADYAAFHSGYSITTHCHVPSLALHCVEDDELIGVFIENAPQLCRELEKIFYHMFKDGKVLDASFLKKHQPAEMPRPTGWSIPSLSKWLKLKKAQKTVVTEEWIH